MTPIHVTSRRQSPQNQCSEYLSAWVRVFFIGMVRIRTRKILSTLGRAGFEIKPEVRQF